MNTSEILKNLREERHLSQLEMSRRAGISQATISAIEKGDRQPSMQMIDRLAKFFGVPASTLFQTTTVDSASFDQETFSTVMQNKKLRKIFDMLRYMNDDELGVVDVLVTALSSIRNNSND